MRLQNIILCFIYCLFILTSCHFLAADDSKKNKNNVAISVIRFDKLLSEYVELNSFSALQKMNTVYPVETKLLIEDVLELGQVNENNINEKLKEYFSDSTLHILMADALKKFENMEDIEKKLSQGFSHLKEEVPSIVIPAIYSQISALNGSIIVGDSTLGFSIDKYMGEDYPLYKRYYYDYQRRSMSPERIAPDCIAFYLMSEYPFPMDRNRRTLLNIILHYGKIHYVTTKVLDFKSYEEELGYTKDEKEWCVQNRKKIWEYMLDSGHLNATDPMTIRKYTRPAPYTSYFGENSPTAVGIWVGTQIIDSYMKQNKGVSIKDLLDNTDYQQMLIDAKYNP